MNDDKQLRAEPCRSVTIGLPVSDLEAAAAWYRQLLGQVEELSPVPEVRELALISGVWLQLFESAEFLPNPSVLRLETLDIEASHAKARRIGEQVGEIEYVPGAVRYFDFRDPFGNQLSYYLLVE